MMEKLSQETSGVLAIWKPSGMTSHDVVARLRRLTGIRRIGHTGTLDPAVTGVLPLCIGRATRFVEYLQEMPKSYEATLTLGLATDTEDATGRPVAEADASHLTEEKIAAAVFSFVGDIQQVPPMVSAVKVDGKRLYELARQGVTVERQARSVTIHAIELLEMKTGGERPEVRFAVICSKGTYIRTLCADIGAKLNVPAAMGSLVRTESAGLRREDCLTIEQAAERMADGTLGGSLVPADRLLRHLPSAEAGSPEAEHALQGKKLPTDRLRPSPDKPGVWRLYRESDGELLGLFHYEAGERTVRPVKVFHPGDGRKESASRFEADGAGEAGGISNGDTI